MEIELWAPPEPPPVVPEADREELRNLLPQLGGSDVREAYVATVDTGLDSPEINGLDAYRRNQGIGTALVRTAEEYARKRGYRRIGLGVADDNPDAARLYRRLGYVRRSTYTGSYIYINQDGVGHEIVEHVTFMVLDL